MRLTLHSHIGLWNDVGLSAALPLAIFLPFDFVQFDLDKVDEKGI